MVLYLENGKVNILSHRNVVMKFVNTPFLIPLSTSNRTSAPRMMRATSNTPPTTPPINVPILPSASGIPRSKRDKLLMTKHEDLYMHTITR